MKWLMNTKGKYIPLNAPFVKAHESWLQYQLRQERKQALLSAAKAGKQLKLI